MKQRPEKTKQRRTKEERKAAARETRERLAAEIKAGYDEFYSRRDSFFAWLGIFSSLALFSMFFTSWTSGTGAGSPWIAFNLLTRMCSLLMLTLFGVFTPFRKTVFAAGATAWAIWMLLLSDIPYAVPAIVFVAGVFVCAIALRYENKKQKAGETKTSYETDVEWTKYFYFTIALTLVVEIIHEFKADEAFFNIGGPFEMLIKNPDRFMNNVLIIFFTGLFTRICTRRKFATAIFAFVWIALAFISLLKINNVYEPLMVLDIFATMDMAAVVTKYFKWFFFVLLGLGLLIVVAGLVWLIRKEKPKVVKGTGLVIAGILAVLTLVSFIFSSILPYSAFSDDFAIENYYTQGFAASFARTTAGSIQRKPDNFSEENYAEIAANVEKNYVPKADTQVKNIIVIQMESFSDPLAFSELNPELKLEKDPIPFLRSLGEKYSTGMVDVPVYAGQTVKSEFEFLTGIDLVNLPDGLNPYVTVINDDEIDSLPRHLSSIGFTTTGIHNYQGEFFSRHLVYDNIGFDRFVPVECMKNVRRRGSDLWASDDVLAGQIKRALDENSSRKFIFVSTVQLHGNYPVIKSDEFPMHIEGLEKGSDIEGQFQYYVGQLMEFDAAMKSIVEMLEERGEPTVLLMYADHLPGIANELCDLPNEDTFRTRYYSWDNIGLARTEEDLPLYRLSTMLLGRAGVDGSFINRFHEVYGAIGGAQYEDASEIVDYKLLYTPDKLFDSERDMVFGFEKPEILSIEELESENSPLGNVYKVKAAGLTEDTVVTVNGKMYNLNLENDYEAVFETGWTAIKQGDVITLRIVGERLGTVFAESREFVYEPLTEPASK